MYLSMDPSVSIPAHPSDLARAVAALANSGGGCFILEGEHEPGREALTHALTYIVPPPVISDTKTCRTPEKKRQVLINGIVRPANVTIREEDNGLIVTVTPGESLCTVGGEVVIFEEGKIRALTLTEVVRRSGSGG